MPHTSTRTGNNDRALRSTAAEVAGEGIRRLGIVEEAVAEDLGYEAVARTDQRPFPLQTGLRDMIRTWPRTSSFGGGGGLLRTDGSSPGRAMAEHYA